MSKTNAIQQVAHTTHELSSFSCSTRLMPKQTTKNVSLKEKVFLGRSEERKKASNKKAKCIGEFCVEKSGDGAISRQMTRQKQQIRTR